VQAFVDVLTPEPASQPRRAAAVRRDDDDHDDDSREDGRVQRLEAQIERLSDQLNKKGPPCPHCGGELAADAASEEYRLCPHCRLEVLWHRGKPFADQAGVAASIEKEQRRQEAEETQKREAKARAREKQAAAKTEQLAAQAELESRLASLGLLVSPVRCAIHTTHGILVTEIRPEWSLKWAIWFASGVRQNAWTGAEISQITPNCDYETGFFGGIKQGKRRGSYIHFKPVSDISMPLTDEVLESQPVRRWLKKKRKESPCGPGDATERSSWKLHVRVMNTDSPWIVLHNSGTSVDVPTIGVLDVSASAQTLARLESAHVGQGDRPDPPLTLSHVVLEGVAREASPTRLRISAGTCTHLAAVIAAVDGKLSQDELQLVVATLVRIGVPEDQAKDRFVKVCKRVAQEGIDESTETLCSMLVSTDQAGSATGLTPADLSTLLHTLVTAGGGDTPKKQLILSRFVAALRG